MTVNESEALHKIDAAENLSLSFGVAPKVPDPVEVIVTPAPAAKVTCPAPIC